MDEAVVGRKVDGTIHLGEGVEPGGSLLDEREQRLKGLGDGCGSGRSSDGSMIITNVAQEVEDQLLNARRPMTKNDDNQFQKQQEQQ
jgi:hypothetical protein